jgi:hypothetical protein
MNKTKICKTCKREFIPKSSAQKYCGEMKTKICKVCGKEFTAICQKESNEPQVCSRKCAGALASVEERVCQICGSRFKPTSARQKYCRKPIQVFCKICNHPFYTYCGELEPKSTCGNKSCRDIFAHQQSQKAYQAETRICKWCGKEFHPVNNTQIYCTRRHIRKCEVCGKEFEIDLTKQDKPKTCSAECAHKLSFKDGNPFQDPEFREKAKQTLFEHYGVDHPMRSKEIVNRMQASYEAKTGYKWPAHNPEVRSKQAKASKISKFEQRVAALFDEYNIHYVHHYLINSETASHEFDFYLPDYKFLIDCDGVYFHSYLEDPDGGKVTDYYDEDRLALVPQDHIFHVIVEGQEEKDIKEITKILKRIDEGIFDYEGELFNWCRSIEFPYPKYEESRMIKDYASLCKYHASEYTPAARLGDSLIQNFHKSIYNANVRGYVSPKQAWYDDKLLKKVILNRLIYKNDVDPFKILRGFNISKICPRVSVFNPVLAKHLVEKYLLEFDSVFDPFSGYSGRMLGALSLNKTYIGQDLNPTAVQESNEILDFIDKHGNANVSLKNVFESQGNYDCLLTCPPYANKEHYCKETEIKNCDDWIDEITERFKCYKYVFVVDNVDKYSQFIVEEIKSTSHFCTTKEYVVVIAAPTNL